MTSSATPVRTSDRPLDWAQDGRLDGLAAESLERFRPGYPDEVVDRTLAYAGRPVSTAVEIGAGTGKAARAFASRGVRVTALESDPWMREVLERETVGMQVVAVDGTLTSYDGPLTDLVYAAASWHDCDAATRGDRAADLLVEGGIIALFETRVRLADPAARTTLAEAGIAVLEAPTSLSERELVSCPRFADVEEHRVAHQVLLPQREYVGYLSTLTEVQEMSTDGRLHDMRRMADVLPAQIRLELSVLLQVARRC